MASRWTPVRDSKKDRFMPNVESGTPEPPKWQHSRRTGTFLVPARWQESCRPSVKHDRPK